MSSHRYFSGFSEETARKIEAAIRIATRDQAPQADGSDFSQARRLRLPFLGEVDTSALSLPVFTVIIAGLDSFNPCAFFVLFFLLSLLVHAHSRRRMAIIGGIFVLFSGIVYFLYMAAWLNLFLLFGKVTPVTVVAGVVALIIGAINIKDFFFFERGVSLVIPEQAKPRLFERMRNLVHTGSLAGMVTATVILALAANTYEVICTAGFPMLYTRTLTLRQLSVGVYYSYLAFYNLVYVVPLAGIVALFVVTLGSRKLTEWQGRVLKLLSGVMMLALAIVLLARPSLLNDAAVSIGLLLATLALTGGIVMAAKHYGMDSVHR